MNLEAWLVKMSVKIDSPRFSTMIENRWRQRQIGIFKSKRYFFRFDIFSRLNCKAKKLECENWCIIIIGKGLEIQKNAFPPKDDNNT